MLLRKIHKSITVILLRKKTLNLYFLSYIHWHILETINVIKWWRIIHLCFISLKSEEESGILGSLCGILHNITMFEDNVPKVRAVKCIEAEKPYLESKDNTIRLLCLATLADLVNESESEMIKSNDEIIEFLMLTISMAIDTDNRASWSLVELSRSRYTYSLVKCLVWYSYFEFSPMSSSSEIITKYQDICFYTFKTRLGA